MERSGEQRWVLKLTWHTDSPVEAATLPGWHNTQADAPTEAWIDPAAHGVQAPARPATAEKEPAGQFTHVVEPVLSANVVEGHSEHTLWPCDAW